MGFFDAVIENNQRAAQRAKEMLVPLLRRARRSSLQPIYDYKRRGPGIVAPALFLLPVHRPLAHAARPRSATAAQLANQHPTAEYHHGDRPEDGGQEDIGAAGHRQVLLPSRGGGLGGGGLPALG